MKRVFTLIAIVGYLFVLLLAMAACVGISTVATTPEPAIAVSTPAPVATATTLPPTDTPAPMATPEPTSSPEATATPALGQTNEANQWWDGAGWQALPEGEGFQLSVAEDGTVKAVDANGAEYTWESGGWVEMVPEVAVGTLQQTADALQVMTESGMVTLPAEYLVNGVETRAVVANGVVNLTYDMGEGQQVLFGTVENGVFVPEKISISGRNITDLGIEYSPLTAAKILEQIAIQEGQHIAVTGEGGRVYGYSIVDRGVEPEVWQPVVELMNKWGEMVNNGVTVSELVSTPENSKFGVLKGDYRTVKRLLDDFYAELERIYSGKSVVLPNAGNAMQEHLSSYELLDVGFDKVNEVHVVYIDDSQVSGGYGSVFGGIYYPERGYAFSFERQTSRLYILQRISTTKLDPVGGEGSAFGSPNNNDFAAFAGNEIVLLLTNLDSPESIVRPDDTKAYDAVGITYKDGLSAWAYSAIQYALPVK